MTATIRRRARLMLVLVGGFTVACTAPPPPQASTPTIVQQAQALPTPVISPVVPTATPAVGFTPATSQRNSAGVPLPYAPNAVNVVVTYTAVPVGAAQPKSGLINVSVGDSYFDPAELHITGGATVEWDYNGGGGETESIHNVIGQDGSSSSGDMNPISRYAYTFKKPGEFDYLCSYHARQMTGKIFVQ